MSRAKNITNTFAATNFVVKRQTERLSHEDSLLQLPFRGNCLNWVLGHILVNRNQALQALGEEPYANEEMLAVYQAESESLTDAGIATSLENLLLGMEKTQTQIAAVMAEMPAAALETIVDEEKNRSLGDRLEGLTWHETYHAGQLELLRQLAGVDDKIF